MGTSDASWIMPASWIKAKTNLGLSRWIFEIGALLGSAKVQIHTSLSRIVIIDAFIWRFHWSPEGELSTFTWNYSYSLILIEDILYFWSNQL